RAAIAPRNRVESEPRQAQKLEALGRLAAGIAHEINTPMQFISDSINFVREGVRELLDDKDVDRQYLSEHLPKALELASSGCDRVGTIVKSMKLLAHADGEPTP